MSNIQERVIKMVAEQLGVKEEDVNVTSSFVETSVQIRWIQLN